MGFLSSPRRLILPAFVIVAAGATLSVLDRWTDTAERRAAEAKADHCYTGQLEATANLPGGQFFMGSDHHYREEAPVEEVEVAPFNIDLHEVTNLQFAEFVEATGYVTLAEQEAPDGFKNPGSAVFSGTEWSFVEGANWRHPEGPDSTIEGHSHEPVVQIALEDAQSYAKWKGRRLPTEIEYEYAARGGLNGKEFAWGDALTPGGRYMANHWQGVFPFSDTGSDGHKGRAPVGCYDANGYGIYDMIGNVWEWTSDPYFPDHRFGHEEDTNLSPNGLDPRQPGVPVGVIKGGSFLCAENYCRRYRPAARHAQDTGMGTNHIGFRTAADLGR